VIDDFFELTPVLSISKRISRVSKMISKEIKGTGS